MPFLYDSLDSLDFERLCADIIGDITSTVLSVYARGRDLGIDASEFLCEDPEHPRIIVQAKHYYHSTYSKLKTALTEDVEKLKRFASEDVSLYLMTSRRLTRSNKEELRAIAGEAGFFRCEVWEEQDISRFLEDPSHAEILRAHYKLWITHTGVLEELYNRDVFIDCEYYLDTADQDARYFIPTKVFVNAREKLEESHAIMLVGDPGTGKTVLSEMLALGYAADGYVVRYTTSTDIHNVMEALSLSREDHELVVLDDFLGGNLLEVRESQVGVVCSLVHHVRNRPNKRVVLNSRVSILNEARRRDVSRRMERWLQNVPLVDTNHLTDLEKARIMIAMMRREGASADHARSLAERRITEPWYRSLVRHRNFNPRIIEYACAKLNDDSVPPVRFPAYLESLLDNPSQVWESEFERLTPSDRCLLHVLYTMPRGTCNGERVRVAFERRIARDSSIDVAADSFSKSMRRLSDSLVRRVVERDRSVCLSAANPSINDYIAGELKHGDALCVRMIQGAEYLDQIERVADVNQSDLVRDEVLEMLASGRLLEMPTLERDPHEVVLGIIGTLRMFDADVREAILECVDACLKLDGILHHAPMAFVSEYARWLERAGDDGGAMVEALCNNERMSLLIRRAFDLEDLGVLGDLYEKARGSLFNRGLRQTFEDAFDNILYERVADYCMDHIGDLANDSGIQPYTIDDDDIWASADEDELRKLREYCANKLDECVNDILDQAEYWAYEVISRNWSWDEVSRMVKDDVRIYLDTEDFDFLSDMSSTVVTKRTLNTQSEEADVDRLFRAYVESLR